MAVKVGDDYVPVSAEAAAKVADASPLDESAKGDNRVVVKLDHNTTEKGAYPIVLVSYDVACPAYKDANTAKFVKSWLTYVTSDEGQQTAASAAGSAPMSNTLRQKVVKSIDRSRVKNGCGLKRYLRAIRKTRKIESNRKQTKRRTREFAKQNGTAAGERQERG